MRALTIWQPWASLIMAGAKPYEFRRWPAPRKLWGRRIVIHAGARPIVPDELVDLRTRCLNGDTALDAEMALELTGRVVRGETCLPLASGLGTAVLGEPKRLVELLVDAADSDRIDQHIWGWPLTGVERFEPIAPARGFQGFWPWPYALSDQRREGDDEA